MSCVRGDGFQGKQGETIWRVIAYLLQLVQRALSDTALLEVILRSIHDLLDDLLVDVALILSISYCDLAYHDRHRGRRQHTTSAFVMIATVRKKDTKEWQRRRRLWKVVIRGRKSVQDVAVASAREVYLAEQCRRTERRRGSRRSTSRKEGTCPLRGYNSLLLDLVLYYLRLFEAVVAVVADCWLVDRGICTGGLSEDGCDVRPQAASRALVMALASRVR